MNDLGKEYQDRGIIKNVKLKDIRKKRSDLKGKYIFNQYNDKLEMINDKLYYLY